MAALAEASQATVKQAATLFEDRVVMAETLDAPWLGFYQQVSDLMVQTYRLNDAILSHLQVQLQDRRTSTACA